MTAAAGGALRPAGQTKAGSALMQPFGPVEYDGAVLPLTSPDGRFVASEAGVLPTSDTLLATDGATVPAATTIEVYELVIAPGRITPPIFRLTLAEPVLLGRACDDEGFLVESPRSNGSRWIGKASWHTGEIEWLVQDTAVNAFATLGPGGRMAWCRREYGDDHFDLVVRNGAGVEWTLDTEDDDWLMPTFSGIGDDLFAVHITGEGGVLSLVYLAGTSRTAALQSMGRRLPLSRYATVGTAYQMTTAYPTTLIEGQPARAELLFHHPVQNRAALWRASAGRQGLISLQTESFAAIMLDSDTAIISTPGYLKEQSLRNRTVAARLVNETAVVRPTNRDDWPFVVLNLSKHNPQIVGVSYMRFVTAE